MLLQQVPTMLQLLWHLKNRDNSDVDVFSDVDGDIRGMFGSGAPAVTRRGFDSAESNRINLAFLFLCQGVATTVRVHVQ
jgi:hypothetical protein